MRRLTAFDRDDHGGGTVFVILAMTAMLIAAGFAIDVGQYVVHARSAQNTADATALAVATDCALTGAPIADYSPYRKSGQTISTPACGNGEATITATKVVGGLLLQQSAGSVNRTATAKWDTLGHATTSPITISDCEFTQAVPSGSATSNITLYLDDTKPQTGCSSLPGGFSRLLNDDCTIEISAGNTVEGQPGGALNQIVPCITPLPYDMLIPLYDAAACQAAGCNGQGPYLIQGFAVFKLTSYSFNGIHYEGSLGKKCPDPTRGMYCIRGDFITFTESQGSPGPTPDFGVYLVYLFS